MNLPAGDGKNAAGESLGDELARVLDLGPRANPVNTASRESAAQAPQAEETDNLEQEPTSEAIEAEKPAVAPETEEQGEETAQGEEIQKFTDLTTLFSPDQEVTESDLYGLEIVTASDGKAVTVGDLKDMYQARQAFEEEKATFAKQREQHMVELEEARQGAVRQAEDLGQLPEELRRAEIHVGAIEDRARSYDWQKLEEEDPGEAALLRQKFRDAHDAAIDRRDQLRGIYASERQKAQQLFVTKQRAKMLEMIPEWKDDKVLLAEREAIDTTVAAYGFTKQDMDSIVDPRYSKLLRDFMIMKKQFDEAVKNRKEVKNRGNKPLRATLRSTPKARIQQTEDSAKRPGATREEKHAAMKAILSDAGFL